MFPLSSNDPYIKDNGERDRLGNVIGSGGSSGLPAHTIADAGKVLTVADDNTLSWETVSGGINQFEFANSPKSVSSIQSKAIEGGN